MTFEEPLIIDQFGSEWGKSIQGKQRAKEKKENKLEKHGVHVWNITADKEG